MAETINMPKLGFDMAEGKLIRWLKKAGEPVKKGELLAEIETDKATVEVESPAGGVVRALLVDEGAVVPVGSPIAIIGSPEEVIETPARPPAETGPALGDSLPDLAAAPEKSAGSGRLGSVPELAGPEITAAEGFPGRASPLARRLAGEKKVDLGKIKGSGPGGRIVRRDIEALQAGGLSMAEAHATAPGVTAPRADERLDQSRLRQAIARRMAESKALIPHFYVTHEYRMGALIELRRQFNAMIPEDQKLSLNDFILKAVALALRQFPNLNASLEAGSVVRHGAINLGVAVSVEGGLLTVVCRNADQKPLNQISSEVRSMAGRARQGKMRPEEIEGSTFSISNLGMFDVEDFQAIINPPEAAILAVGSARQVAVVEEGEIKPGWRMKVSLSVDHRISDGAEGARFLQLLGEFLEQPLKLVL